MARHDDVHELARGRWRGLLLAAGLSSEFLTGKHGPCPTCGGKDRFRYTDLNCDGRSICNKCGSRSGVDLLMAVRGLDFRQAKAWIIEQIGSSPIEPPKSRQVVSGNGRWFVPMWEGSQQLNGICPASKYLSRRGLRFETFPSQLRYLPRCTYTHESGMKTTHPGMLARFLAPDEGAWSLHVTYLTNSGEKADLPKVRKMLGSMPHGGAVRLGDAAETMGIAEGVETALSAAAINEVPVWAALSTGLLVKWKPPPRTRCVIIYGDADESFAGQEAAYGLAKRLRDEGLHVDVRFPDEVGADWNDVLLSDMHELLLSPKSATYQPELR